MLTGLICLWVGFAVGFVCAALMREASKDRSPEPYGARRQIPLKIRD